MRVRIRPEAADEIATICGGISAVSPRAARAWTARLARRLRILRTYPLAGRVVPEFGELALRELILGDFRIWYRVTSDRVEILHVWSARRGTLPDRVEETGVTYRVESYALGAFA